MNSSLSRTQGRLVEGFVSPRFSNQAAGAVFAVRFFNLLFEDAEGFAGEIQVIFEMSRIKTQSFFKQLVECCDLTPKSSFWKIS
jgi:hypothetical protein